MASPLFIMVVDSGFNPLFGRAWPSLNDRQATRNSDHASTTGWK